MHEIRNILAATDLSATSDRVVSAGAALATAADARLHVLHVVGGPALPVSGLGLTPRTDAALSEEHRVDAAKLLAAQIERCTPVALVTLPAVIVGEATPRAICSHAEQVSADLIVIGPHGDGEQGPELLGTTADAVLRSAAVPVLVLRAQVPVASQRVVVAMDPAEPSAGILAVALAWVRAFAPPAASARTTMEIVHVVPDAMGGRRPFDRATVMPGDSPEVDAARARALGVDVRELVLFGDGVEETILGYAREAMPDVMVAGSHGHGLIRRALLGGTSSVLARRASCPVLLVPPGLWSDPG